MSNSAESDQTAQAVFAMYYSDNLFMKLILDKAIVENGITTSLYSISLRNR